MKPLRKPLSVIDERDKRAVYNHLNYSNGFVKVCKDFDELRNAPFMHPNLLINGVTFAMVADNGSGTPVVMALKSEVNISNTAPYTNLTDWINMSVITQAISGGLSFKEKFNPSGYDGSVATIKDGWGKAGDFVIISGLGSDVNDDPVEYEFDDANIFGGVVTTVTDDDWLISTGTEMYHINQTGSIPSLNAIRTNDVNFPSVLANLIDNGYPDFDDSKVIVNQEGETNLQALLAKIVYTSKLAQAGNPGTEGNLLWTYTQLSNAGVLKTEAQVNSLIDSKINGLATTASLNQVISDLDAAESSIIDHESRITTLEGAAPQVGETGGTSIFLMDVVNQSGQSGAINKTTDLYISKTVVTEFSAQQNLVRLKVQFGFSRQYMPSISADVVDEGGNVLRTSNASNQSFMSLSLGAFGGYAADIDIDITDGSKIIIKDGVNAETEVIINTPVPLPVISSIVRETTLSAPKTDFSQGDTVDFLVTFDTATGADGAELNNYFVEGDSIINTSPAPIQLGQGGVNANQLRITVTVSTGDTDSITFTFSNTDGAIAVETETIPIDNTLPSLTISSWIWDFNPPEINQEALKDSEYAISNNGGSSIDIPAGEEITTVAGNSFDWTMGDDSPISYPLSGSVVLKATLNATGRSVGYIDSGTNCSITVRKLSNGTTKTINFLLKIAHNNPTLLSADTPTLRDTSDLLASFDQNVNRDSIALDVGSDLSSSQTGIYSKDKTYRVGISDQDARSQIPVNASLTVTNEAKRTVVINRPYRVKGFTVRNISIPPPYNPFALPVNVSNFNDLQVFYGSDQLTYDETLNSVLSFRLIGNQIQVDSGLKALANGNNINLTVEELV